MKKRENLLKDRIEILLGKTVEKRLYWGRMGSAKKRDGNKIVEEREKLKITRKIRKEFGKRSVRTKQRREKLRNNKVGI